MSASDHAFLAPSGAHIWGPGGCPFYPTMAAKYPGEESEAAREGTAWHELLANLVLGGDATVGDIASNQVVFSEEMLEGAKLWTAEVEKTQAVTGSTGCVEIRTRMPQVHASQCWGTPDWFDVDRPGNTVYVKDGKWGHRYVDPFENPQLVLYGLGALNHFSLVPYGAWDFVFTVVQPRAYHPDGPVKTWWCTGKRFMELVRALTVAADEATSFDPPMRTGPHCNDCEGRTKCPAFQQVAGAALDVSMISAPAEMGPDAIGTMRTLIEAAQKRLKGMATGLDAEIERAARSGRTIPGWELKPTETRLDWTAPLEEVATLGDLMGVPLTKPAAITPTQAIKAGIDEAVIMAYASRPPGGLKVVPSDKTSAAKAFK